MIRQKTQFAGSLMPREIDPEVGTLENSDESNSPKYVINPGIIDA